MSYYNDIQIAFITNKIEQLNQKGADINANSFIERMDTMIALAKATMEYGRKPSFAKQFAEYYKDLLTGNVIPAVIQANIVGQTPKGVGDDLEEIMSYAYNCIPQDVKKEIEGTDPLTIEDYETVVKETFLDMKNPNLAGFYGSIEGNKNSPYQIANALNSYVNNMKNVMNHAAEPEGRDSFDHLVDTALDHVNLVSTHYMKVREEYNSLGFFGKWFSSKGYFLRDCMNNVKDTLKEFNKYADFKVADETISEYIHENAKLTEKTDKKMQESINNFSSRRKITISNEELKSGIPDDPEEPQEDLVDVELANRLKNLTDNTTKVKNTDEKSVIDDDLSEGIEEPINEIN